MSERKIDLVDPGFRIHSVTGISGIRCNDQQAGTGAGMVVLSGNV